jgi:hypothetical protein
MVIVSDAVKQRLDSDPEALILCEQCAVVHGGTPELEEPVCKAEAISDAENCQTCSDLKLQEEAAVLELARCKDLPDTSAAKQAYTKWAHVFHARWDHHFKAHNNEPRGRG